MHKHVVKSTAPQTDGIVIICRKAMTYFCCHCRQLRLALDGATKKCGNCGCKDLIVGDIGTLDRDALIRKLDGFRG